MQYQSQKSWSMTQVLATCAVVAVAAVATGAAVATATTSLYAPAAVQTPTIARATTAFPVAQRMQMMRAAQAPAAVEEADFEEVALMPVAQPQQVQGLSVVQGLLISASALVAGLAAYLLKRQQAPTQWAMAAADTEESTAIATKSYKTTTPAESYYGKPQPGATGKTADPMKSSYKAPVGGYSADNGKSYVPTTDRSASYYSKSSGGTATMPTYSAPVGGYSADNGKTYKPTSMKANSYFGADQGAAPLVRGGMWYGADRPKWLGTLTGDSAVPAYLNGTLPGDYGFDPLGLGANPANLERYREAEVIHGRWAMLGALGCAGPEVMAKYFGYESPEPVWFKAGEYIFNHTGVDANLAGQMQSIFGHANSGNQIPLSPVIIFVCQLVFMGLGEGFRASQITGRDKVYPGKFFDPLLLADGPDAARDQKVKEIKNGRLAMLAMLGFFVQGFLTKQGPIANLADHLADPTHANIFSNIH